MQKVSVIRPLKVVCTMRSNSEASACLVLFQGLSRLLRLEQKSCLSKTPRCGHIVVPHTRSSRRHIAAMADAGLAATQTDCDYSSLYLPKHLTPRECIFYLADRASKLRAGTPQKVVWDWMYYGRYAREIWDNKYVLDATPLLAEYPNLNLGIPLELTWVTENPGRQGRLTGSFHPLEGVDWTQQAYARCACCL